MNEKNNLPVPRITEHTPVDAPDALRAKQRHDAYCKAEASDRPWALKPGVLFDSGKAGRQR